MNVISVVYPSRDRQLGSVFAEQEKGISPINIVVAHPRDFERESEKGRVKRGESEKGTFYFTAVC